MADLREIQLKLGQPAVADGLSNLQEQLSLAKKHKVKVLKLVHGYGSTGKGGKLRTAVRKQLETLQEHRNIKCYIKGEDFSIFNENTRTALNLCPTLRKDEDLERHNNGITLVVL